MKTNPNEPISTPYHTDGSPMTVHSFDDNFGAFIGLTKREYFAVHSDIQEEIKSMAEKGNRNYWANITKTECPPVKGDLFALPEDHPERIKHSTLWAEFWYKVEAGLKVMKADALIRALNDEKLI